MSMNYPTPVYSHAGRGDFQDVYEPAEDSFLLIDALEKDAGMLQQMRFDVVFFLPFEFPYLIIFKCGCDDVIL